MASVDENPHALVVPSSGQGHVNGCMQLAQSLANVGFKVTFVYFSSYYAKLKAQKRVVDIPDLGHTEKGGDPSSHQHSPSSRDSSIGGGFAPSRGTAITTTTTTTTVEGDASSTTSISAKGNSANGHLSNGGNSRGFIHIHVVEDGFSPGDVDKLFFVTPSMEENLFNLILELREQGTPPTCLISDTFLPWTLRVAERAGIPRIDYWTSNAMSYLLIYSVPLLFSLGIFPEKGSPTQWKRETPLIVDQISGLLPFSSEIYPKELRFGDASSLFVSFFSEVSSCAKFAERILIHTMSELEPDAFQGFQALGIPAYAIGPLLHDTKKPQAKENLGQLSIVSQLNEEIDCISWLNRQAESSVIYVAFGSHASFSVEEIQELAYGLEASGNPFLWVIREDSLGGAELPQVLPDGFRERTSAKGMIISWAPQVEVLAHKAVGGFLTHCGWNSTFESLWAGVPMLCCPCFAEQRSNARYTCEVWGVGLELGRTETGGLERRYVEDGVRSLMEEEEGLKAKGKAQEVMELARKTCQQGGQSYSNLQKFYDDMKMLSSNRPF